MMPAAHPMHSTAWPHGTSTALRGWSMHTAHFSGSGAVARAAKEAGRRESVTHTPEARLRDSHRCRLQLWPALFESESLR